MPCCQQMGDAVRDHARLAAAGAGQDQQRAIDVRDGLALGGGETGENIGGASGALVSIRFLGKASAAGFLIPSVWHQG